MSDRWSFHRLLPQMFRRRRPQKPVVRKLQKNFQRTLRPVPRQSELPRLLPFRLHPRNLLQMFRRSYPQRQHSNLHFQNHSPILQSRKLLHRNCPHCRSLRHLHGSPAARSVLCLIRLQSSLRLTCALSGILHSELHPSSEYRLHRISSLHPCSLMHLCSSHRPHRLSHRPSPFRRDS